MSCFTLCDMADCNGNEGTNEMFHVSNEIEEILKNAGYDFTISDLCEPCLKDLSKDNDINKIIFVNKYDELITENEDDNLTLFNYVIKRYERTIDEFIST